MYSAVQALEHWPLAKFQEYKDEMEWFLKPSAAWGK